MDHSAAVGAVRRHLDRLGDREWARLEADATGRVSIEVHRRFLRRFVREGAHVLEIGAGSGRFTADLAAIGCRVVVTDPSPAQLAAHERRLRRTATERCVVRREPLDDGAPARYATGEFDAVLAYGGPLSCTVDRATATLRTLLRTVRPDGVVVASVPSLLGSWRHTLPDGTAPIGTAPDGTAPSASARARYRWSDVEALVDAAGGVLVEGSASNWASLGDPGVLARIEADRARWRRFLDDEVAACAEPGARDGGTHILFAARPA